MLLLTSQEMRRLDELSIKRDHVSSLELMENAGKAVFKIIARKYGRLKGKKVFVFCGPGNNGGDGFVVARHLLRHAGRVFVFVISEPDRLSDDSRVNFEKLGRWAVSWFFTDFSLLENRLKREGEPFLVVDAIFGTGLVRELSGLYRDVVDRINKYACEKVSIDIPSGLCADTGRIPGSAVKASVTVALGFPKLGFFLGDAHDYVGELHVVPIGLSDESVRTLENEKKESGGHFVNLATREDFSSLLKPRKKTANKGSFGHVYVIGGSLGKIGAGVMAAHTALGAGAGLSTLVLPLSAYNRIDLSALEIMYEPVEDHGAGFFGPQNIDRVLALVNNASVTAIGPGLGLAPDTVQFVHDFVRRYRGVLVVDADGLNAVALEPDVLNERRQCPTILTPHPGEMARLADCSTAEVQSQRIEVAHAFSEKYGVILLLKGYRSVLVFPDGRTFINPTGNPAMASAGQGDVLTGIFSGLLAQAKEETFSESLLFGCFLHGLVGDLLAKKGYRVVLATDITKNLPLGYSFLRKNHEVLSTVFY